MPTFTSGDLISKPKHLGQYGEGNIYDGVIAVPNTWANADILRPCIIPAGSYVEGIIIANDALCASGGNVKVGYSFVDGTAQPSGADLYFSAAASLTAPFAAASNGLVLCRFTPIKLELDAFLELVATSAVTTPAAGNLYARVLSRNVGVK